MANAQQLIGLVKSHAEGNSERFFDLSMQLAAIEEQKGHTRLAKQLREWAEFGQQKGPEKKQPTLIASPRGDLAEVLQASYPEKRLSNLVLNSTTVDELNFVVRETRMSAQLETKGLTPRKRVLLCGPPGTGKTMSAHALAGELKFPLFTVMLHGLITKFMGETAQKLRMVFDAVHATRGVYLFDEIDALAAMRTSSGDAGEARRILNSFLQFLDEDSGPSIIIATTNLPQVLDRAILRRFDLVLNYSLPDQKSIKTAIQKRLTGFDLKSIKWAEITSHAEGLSTADVIAAAEDAARRVVLDDETAISSSALLLALDRRRSLQMLGVKQNEKGSGSSSPE